MPNNNELITVIQNSLNKVNSNSVQQKTVEPKLKKQLDYELMFSTLERVVLETMAEYGGTESMDFLRTKYVEKFGHLAKLLMGQKD